MQKSLFEGNGVTSLGSIDGEKDLEPRDGINTTPPPDEDCCSCCKRPRSELTPFVEGIFFGKTSRGILPRSRLVQRIYGEFFGKCLTEKDVQEGKGKLAQKYGEKKAEQIINYADFSGCSNSSWECRDCICLDEYDFFWRRLDSKAPPERCNCCGRHLGELKPFTEGDPVMDYFNGKKLARRNRPDAPPTEGVNKMMDTFFGNCITNEDNNEAIEKLIQKYGDEEAEKLWTFAFFLDPIFKSTWECKDCIALDTAQYFEKKMAQESDSAHDSSG